MDIETYALCKKYTDEEVAGGGAIKGKNCVVTEIEDITGGHRVHFQWTLDDGTVQTDTMDVMDGEDGTVVSASETNGNIIIDGVETQVYDDSEIKGELTTDETTIEGNPLNFTTKSAQTAESTIVDLEPIQDLHGYDKPWVGGAGKNKWSLGDINLESETGVSFNLPAGTYTIQCDLPTSSTRLAIRFVYGDSTNILVDAIYLNNPKTFTLEKECVSINTFISNFTSGLVAGHIQIEQGSTATSYEPYENLCPISGRTEIGILGTNGKESTDPDYKVSNDLTISLGQTVYGGTLDVEKGILTVDRASDDLSQRTWAYNSEYNMWVSSSGLSNAKSSTPMQLCDTPYNKISNVGNDLGSNINGVYNIWIRNGSDTIEPSGIAVYELATPITIQLTPNEISLLEGVNNISTDGDNITLTYRDGSVATLGDVKALGDEMSQEIADSQILTDTVTGDKYKLVVTSGVLSIEQISNEEQAQTLNAPLLNTLNPDNFSPTITEPQIEEESIELPNNNEEEEQ